MEETISLQEIFQTIKKRLKLIISITILAAILAAVLSYFVLTPKYEATSQFIVNQSEQQQGQMAQYDSSQIRTNVELINTYNVIITSAAILTNVVEELNLPYSADTLSKKINVSSEQNSQVVNVKVTDTNQARAADIANTTVTVFRDNIIDIMNVDNVKVLTTAELKGDAKPVDPKPTLNIAIAVVLGLMLGVGLAFLLEYLDTTLVTEEDVENELELPVIAAISTVESSDIRTPLNQGAKDYIKKEGVRDV